MRTSTIDIIKIMQAFLAGKPIQSRQWQSSEWLDNYTPSWEWGEYDYRVKPDDTKTDNNQVEPAPYSTDKPVAWQFFQDGEWYMGMDSIPDHRRNTEDAGYFIRELFAGELIQKKRVSFKDEQIDVLKQHLLKINADDPTINSELMFGHGFRCLKVGQFVAGEISEIAMKRLNSLPSTTPMKDIIDLVKREMFRG